jgi:hypothetical protein
MAIFGPGIGTGISASFLKRWKDMQQQTFIQQQELAKTPSFEDAYKDIQPPSLFGREQTIVSSRTGESAFAPKAKVKRLGLFGS